jgi:hypothetical protein
MESISAAKSDRAKLAYELEKKILAHRRILEDVRD